MRPDISRSSRSVLAALVALLVLLLAAAAAAETVRDEFNAISYAGSNGTQPWTGDWQEVVEADGPTGGVVQVITSNRCAAGNCLAIGGDRVDIGGRGAVREANLSGSSSAILTFHRRLRKFRNTTNSVSLQVSPNGGASWTTLATWVMNGSGSASSEIFDISAYIATNTQIRFLGAGSNARGLMHLDDVQIDYPLSVDHFAIAHAGNADTCTPEPVTFTRHDPTHAVDTGYTGTITLSTSSGNGDWSLLAGAGTLTNLGGGAGSYSYAAADAGQVVLGLLNGVNESLGIDVTDGTASEDPAEDPSLTFSSSGTTETYRDDFAAVSYANQDGTRLWSANWSEVDGAGAGPAAGNAFVAGGELVLEDYANTNLDTSAEREADLSGASAATFGFDFRTTPGVDNNDAVFAEVSGDGGASWTILERITRIRGAVSGSRSYDITPWIATNTRVRIRVDGLNGTGGTGCCYGAANEEFRVAFVEIAAAFPVACGPDHFSIAHDGTAVHCQAENVTIAAHGASHGVDTSYAGTITLSTSTSHGDWSLVTGAGTLTNLGSGAGTYVFDPADAGQVVLGLLDTFAETLNIGVADGSIVEDPTEDPDLVFAATGFDFLADGVASAIGTQIGGKPSNLAPGAQALELRAIRTSDQTGACEAALQGSNAVELAFSCVDPTICSGALVSVNGVGVAANDFAAPLAYTPVNLDFGNATDTTAPIVVAYPDVGRIQLHARYALLPSGENLLGASNVFAVAPFAFHLTVAGNPGATGPTDPIFIAAGANFSAAIRAVLWQAADDPGGDGIADGHADLDPANNVSLADNPSAVSFGREAAAEGVALAANLVAPGGGIDPGLGGATAVAGFVGGAANSGNVYFDEVGIAELSSGVTDGDYLGIGPALTARILGRTGTVGRFSPDHFDVGVDTAPIFQTGCDAGLFTYVGQPFDFSQAPVLRVTARSFRNTQTRNYTGAWWKITNTSLQNRTYTADPASPAALDPSGLPAPAGDPAILDLGDGSGTLTFDAGTGLLFTKAAAVAEFQAEIALSIDVVDADLVAYNANPFQVGDPSPGNGIVFTTSKLMRYGRMALQNAYGSELTPLPVPLRAELFDGTGWVVHAADACTLIPVASVGTLARSPAGLVTAPAIANTPLLAGDAGLSLSPPGIEGWADLLVNLDGPPVATAWGPIAPAGLPWLQWDWATEGAAPPTGNPTARATFGIYPGQRPVIFRREVY